MNLSYSTAFLFNCVFQTYCKISSFNSSLFIPSHTTMLISPILVPFYPLEKFKSLYFLFSFTSINQSLFNFCYIIRLVSFCSFRLSTIHPNICLKRPKLFLFSFYFRAHKRTINKIITALHMF